MYTAFSVQVLLRSGCFRELFRVQKFSVQRFSYIFREPFRVQGFSVQVVLENVFAFRSSAFRDSAIFLEAYFCVQGFRDSGFSVQGFRDSAFRDSGIQDSAFRDSEIIHENSKRVARHGRSIHNSMNMLRVLIV